MKTNGVPAIIMLAAGFIDCVIAILTHMSLWNFTRQPVSYTHLTLPTKA